METMIGFHGSVATKRKYLARVRNHRKADQLIQGTGWSGGKGCAVGCTLHDYNHSRYPIELGVPVALAYLEDRIFERLSNEDAQDWPERFLSAIPVGADLSLVWPRFSLWVLRGLPAKSLERADVRAAVDGVAKLFERWIEAGVRPVYREWQEAREVAWKAQAAAYDATAAAAADAAATAAYDAAAADAAATAAAAAADAADAGATAAYDAAAAAARRSARGKFWLDSASELVRLMASAPRPGRR